VGSLKCFPMVGLRGDVSVNPNKLSVVAVRMVKIVTVRRRLDRLLVGLSVAVMAVLGLNVALPLPVVELIDATLLNSMLLLLPWPLTGGSALLFVLAFAGEGIASSISIGGRGQQQGRRQGGQERTNRRADQHH